MGSCDASYLFLIDLLSVIYAPDPTLLEDDDMASFGVSTLGTLDESAGVPQGPYFMSASTGDIYMAYRLYSDFVGSFTESVFATPDGNFRPLSAAVEGTASLTIGVPSRLYYSPSVEKPLAGIRVGIKDIYDVAGIKTSNGNRAFYNLYPQASASSVVVQKLVDAGAVIVGKQKTSQFANGQMATADWVDYHSPFNARGDGYQDPSSSSSGAGSSIGSYPWLDIAVGSDTGGSIRGPSQTQGLFGNRPSHGAVELRGVMPLSPDLDTAGFLTRDPSIWVTAQEVLYGPLPAYSSYPKKVLTYNFPTNASSAPTGLILDFLAKFQSFLSANVSSFNVTSEWTTSGPENLTSSLTNLLNLTYAVIISKQQTRLVRDPFFADYAAVHDGRRPFVDPSPFTRWTYGDTLPDSALEEALFNKTIFMDWFRSKVLTPDPFTCSNAFMLYVGSTATPNPRNQYIMYVCFESILDSRQADIATGHLRYLSASAAVASQSFPRCLIVSSPVCCILKSKLFTVLTSNKVGQAPYYSNITQHTEYLPVAIDVLAAKGCDGIIAKLATDLVKAGILNAPQAGQTIYGGEILHKREDGDQ